MKYSTWICLIILTTMSCSKNNNHSNELGCETPMHFTQTESQVDVLKHFQIDLPKHWKTSLYYDEFVSQIYTADTTKQLTDTYIIETTWHQGELIFDNVFEEKMKSLLLEKEQLETVKFGYYDFLKHKSYFNLSVNKSTDITYHFLQIYLKYDTDSYYTFTTKIYGDNFVNERICASLALFNTTKFLN